MSNLGQTNSYFLTEALLAIIAVCNEWANAQNTDAILCELGQIAKKQFHLPCYAIFKVNNQRVDQLLCADECGRTLQAHTQQLTEHMSRQARSGQYGNALWLGSKNCEWIKITPVQSLQKRFAILVTTTDPHGKAPSLKQALLTVLCSLAGGIIAVKQLEPDRDAMLANAQREQELVEWKHAEGVEHQRRVLAETLRDIVTDLYSALDINVVLDSILPNLERVVPHDTSNLMLIENDVVRVARCHGYQDRATEEALLALRFPVEVLRAPDSGIDFSQPILVSDISDPPRCKIPTPAGQVRSYAGIPISTEKENIGYINLESVTPGYFTCEHTKLLSVFAYHAAIAVQNARLYEQALTLATNDERHRIANELHDSVTQTLWSATLVADVLPKVWVNNNAQGLHTLARLQQLTHGALAEMRHLLLELRPDALTQITLEDGLRALIDTTASRTGLEIVSISEGHCSLQPNTQLTLYRIAQEALTNASRHAWADRIVVELNVEADQLMLSIRDNGRGFNPQDVPPGHMGLAIMRERARSIHAALEISSQTDCGTQVVVICPLQKA